MVILVDSNVLIRLEITTDPAHPEVAAAVRILRHAGHALVMAAQGAAEFWSVATRPAAARGGYGLSVAQADNYLADLEALFGVRYDSDASYLTWRGLIVRHGVQGVQAHDARIAALMMSERITHILTYSGKDFTRFPGISALSPADVVAGTVPP